MNTRVIGIDPGPTPGIVRLELGQHRITGVDVVQCSGSALWDVLQALTADWYVVEKFVVRGRASRSSTPGAGEETRGQIGALSRLFPGIVERSASQVKPWATDARLDAAVLLEDLKGMRHARDAARHALFAAVHDLGLPDPLSRRSAK